MSSDTSKILKAAEKFKKNSEKELERVRALLEKNQRLTSMAASIPLLTQLLDRVKQKELQSTGDLIWIEQYMEQLRAETGAKAEPATSDAAGKDGEKKKKTKSK
jgi:hypothetical protein